MFQISRNHFKIFARHYCINSCKTVKDNQPLTLDEIRCTIRKRLGLKLSYKTIAPSREHLLKYSPKKDELPPRSLMDSFTEAIVPLSKDVRLQNKYVSVIGHVRTGRLLEDLDAFAVWVCHQHVYLPKLPKHVHLPYTFVTIAVNNVIRYKGELSSEDDILISGHVAYVGKTSMEIKIVLSQKDKRHLKAYFLMAARNSTNTAPNLLNPLKFNDENEKKIYDRAMERQKERSQNRQKSLFKMRPNEFEEYLIHETFLKTIEKNKQELNKRVLPSNSRWMSDSYAINTLPCYPQFRNAQNTVFGGYIMRLAIQISWVNAFQYCQSRPDLYHISNISFKNPVKLGTFLKLTSYVVYTELNYIEIRTIANIIDPYSNQQLTSNVFHFTYKTKELVPEVLPVSYHEAMWYIIGRRKFKAAIKTQEAEEKKYQNRKFMNGEDKKTDNQESKCKVCNCKNCICKDKVQTPNETEKDTPQSKC